MLSQEMLRASIEEEDLGNGRSLWLIWLEKNRIHFDGIGSPLYKVKSLNVSFVLSCESQTRRKGILALTKY